jgi:hypothetical protein
MKQTLHNILRNLFMSGILIVLVYVIFQAIALSYPEFGQTFIFKFFDVGAEGNLPTFFSVLLFLLLSAGSFTLGKLNEKRNKIAWSLTSFLFLFLAIDEFTQIHEQFTRMFQQLVNADGFFFFAWVIPYGIILILLAILYIPFLIKLPKKTRMYIFLGAGVYVLGAIGFEMIGASLYQVGTPTTMYIVISGIEEALEIAGLLLAIIGIVSEVIRHDK